MKKLLIIFCLIFIGFSGFSQEFSTQDKKAIEAYKQAIKNFELQYYDQAETFIKLALRFDNTFCEAYYLWAGIYTMKKDQQQMFTILKNCVSVCGEKYPFSYYKLAYEQYDNGLYEDAFANLQILQTKQQKLMPDELVQFKKLFASCEQSVALKSHPINFTPTNMGPNINTKYDDFHPAITVDEELFLLTSNIPANASMNQEDLFYCVKNGNEWTPRMVFPKPITTTGNEGAESISADGKTMIFTLCNAQGGLGSCDIYITYKVGNQWIKPMNIGAPVNSRYWESQPTLSADGRTLYFVSNRQGGQGKKDIWMSKLDDNNKWSNPKNLGPNINTKDEEESPFIHADGTTLYYSSDGLPGMGKKDIFVTKQINDTTWQKPVNLGYPLNTSDKESLLIINAAGTKGYMASNRYGSTGGYDIYEFGVDGSFPMQPTPVTYVKGLVIDAKNSAKKIPAYIQLSDITTGKVFYEKTADNITGDFIVPFTKNKTYALSVSFPGYLFYSESVSLEKVKQELLIPLQPIQIGNSVVLNNVFFNTDSYELKPESKTELLTIAEFMKSNPKICFEVGGHTDNTGNKQKNITLSENRAKAVYTFLIQQGIPATNLSFKGYADTKPVVDNTTPANRAKNRRTELIVTKM